MRKNRIISAVMAAAMCLSLGATALASDQVTQGDYTGTLLVNKYQMWRDFEAITVSENAVDLITVNLACCYNATGAAVGDGDYQQASNATTVTASEGFVYTNYPNKISAFGAHAAYDNGTAVFSAYTDSVFA